MFGVIILEKISIFNEKVIEVKQGELFAKLQQCYTLLEFKQFYEQLFTACAGFIRNQKLEKVIRLNS
ncbi:hypothetical protein ACFQI7_21480 [Paenibacillus allorhizosphaerae]|uniref:hypothetical protein n=1 Tax=Paenibacillus allorhizosphaerae TaxID=2849866 RepID=UPI001E549007|nr:hypothetical protein [Paenibacillus allorhizosphaerae]